MDIRGRRRKLTCNRSRPAFKNKRAFGRLPRTRLGVCESNPTPPSHFVPFSPARWSRRKMVGRGPLLRSQGAQRRSCITKKLVARVLLLGGVAAYVAYIGVRPQPGLGHTAAVGNGAGLFHDSFMAQGESVCLAFSPRLPASWLVLGGRTRVNTQRAARPSLLSTTLAH